MTAVIELNDAKPMSLSLSLPPHFFGLFKAEKYYRSCCM